MSEDWPQKWLNACQHDDASVVLNIISAQENHVLKEDLIFKSIQACLQQKSRKTLTLIVDHLSTWLDEDDKETLAKQCYFSEKELSFLLSCSNKHTHYHWIKALMTHVGLHHPKLFSHPAVCDVGIRGSVDFWNTCVAQHKGPLLASMLTPEEVLGGLIQAFLIDPSFRPVPSFVKEFLNPLLSREDTFWKAFGVRLDKSPIVKQKYQIIHPEGWVKMEKIDLEEAVRNTFVPANISGVKRKI